jgi:hypothetical protein
LPAAAAPLDELTVFRPVQPLQHHHDGHHRRWHRPPADHRDQIDEQFVREQHVPPRMQEREDLGPRQHVIAEATHRVQQVQLLRGNSQRHQRNLPTIGTQRWPPRQQTAGLGVLVAGLWAGLAWGVDGPLPLPVSGLSAAALAAMLITVALARRP